MRKLEEVENQVRNLSGPELAEFRKWYAEFDAQAWDRQFEADVKSGIEFITADQPAINTHGAFLSADTPVENFELFYPVSPSRAVIISGHAIYQDVHGRTLDSIRTSYFNQAIEHVAYECLFARSKTPLTEIATQFCSRASAS